MQKLCKRIAKPIFSTLWPRECETVPILQIISILQESRRPGGPKPQDSVRIGIIGDIGAVSHLGGHSIEDMYFCLFFWIVLRAEAWQTQSKTNIFNTIASKA